MPSSLAFPLLGRYLAELPYLSDRQDHDEGIENVRADAQDADVLQQVEDAREIDREQVRDN